MQQKAFLFDMDGVIINSEQEWENVSEESTEKIYGKTIKEKIGDLTGVSIDKEYELATQYGFTMDKKTFAEIYDRQAVVVYKTAQVTDGLENLLKFLKENDFVIGIVSSSRKVWIEAVLAKISYRHMFDYILSLNEAELPSKPNPEGFLRAMKDLGVTPQNTIILEDSNSGITAAKKAGAYTIAFTPLLVKGYKQIPADASASSIHEVIEIVKKECKISL
jgi:sugar-phosphatase